MPGPDYLVRAVYGKHAGDTAQRIPHVRHTAPEESATRFCPADHSRSQMLMAAVVMVAWKT